MQIPYYKYAFQTPLRQLLASVSLFIIASLPVSAESDTIATGAIDSHSKIEHVLTKFTNLSDIKKVQRINRFVNKLDNVTDQKLWGKRDYWATPKELFKKGAGDCEDLAIAKYYLLIKFGVDESKLRLAYVKAFNSDNGAIEDHLVLLYQARSDSAPLVLDNLTDAIQSTEQRNDLILQIAFNREQSWPLNDSFSEQTLQHSSVLHAWQAFIPRLKID